MPGTRETKNEKLPRLADLLAEWNGKPLNTAAVARRLGVSRPTAVARIGALERAGLVRLVPFFGGTQKPLFYLLDRFLLSSESFRAFCVDSTARVVLKKYPKALFFWWKTGRVRQIDLLVAIGAARIGFCFSNSPFTRNRHWYPLALGFLQGVIHYGYFLELGKRAYSRGQVIKAMPFSLFLADPEGWITQALARIVVGPGGAPLGMWFRRGARKYGLRRTPRGPSLRAARGCGTAPRTSCRSGARSGPCGRRAAP